MIKKDIRWWAQLIIDEGNTVEGVATLLERFIVDARHGSSARQINEGLSAIVGVSTREQTARARVYEIVDAERARQDRLFPGQSIGSTNLSDLMKLRILTEELGEVAEALDTKHANEPRQLNDELVQVAACAVGWLEGRMSTLGVDGATIAAEPCDDCGCAAPVWVNLPTERTRCLACFIKAYLKIAAMIDGVRKELTEPAPKPKSFDLEEE